MAHRDRSSLQEILSLCPYRGSFKPPQSLAREDPFFSGKDFYKFDATVPFSIGTRADDLWEEEWIKNSKENVILVEGNNYDTRPFAARLVRHVNPTYGIEKVLSIAAVPGAYAQNPDFSVDSRKGVGTAHFALDFLVLTEDFAAVMDTLREDPMTLVSPLRAMQVTAQRKNVDLYKHFFLNGETSYSIRVK
ncbi:hypothetical protein HYW21_09365 [Candidatus Woesearchaeota archaeon]|nr:hypothetical protein [Candidatus Woesearchaeota archaeon]